MVFFQTFRQANKITGWIKTSLYQTLMLKAVSIKHN